VVFYTNLTIFRPLSDWKVAFESYVNNAVLAEARWKMSDDNFVLNHGQLLIAI